MNFAVLAEAPLAVQVHLATVLPAFLIGGWSLFVSRPGSVAHRAAGRVFAALMATTAATTVFIPSHFGFALALGPLRMSPIHLLIPLTLHGLWTGIGAIRAGQVERHRAIMRRLFFAAIVVAGLFTLLPGRRLHYFLFM
jgi:uncharacterized membrane protein